MNQTSPILRRLHRIRNHSLELHQRVWRLVCSPLFIWLTVVFHALIIGAALCLWRLEASSNPTLASPMNAIYWSFSTVTTVGYGDVVPHTVLGKVLAIALMMIGSIFTAIYTALFASTLLASEFANVEKDVVGVKREFRELEKEYRADESHVESLLLQLQEAIASMKSQR